MGLPAMTPDEVAHLGDDRRPALFGTLISLLVLNNGIAAARCYSRWATYYRKNSWKDMRIFPEDPLVILAAALVDVMISNLLASTAYGLGLHSWRINQDDPQYPQNLSVVFKHVWITMVFTGPTFTAIKLALLYFYRRIFLFNQTWLRIAWWANMVYVLLWLIGATGFYLFQCWPVQWYYMQYYSRYHVSTPYPIEGQCNATTTMHVALPLIFGLLSDVAILLLPIFAISKLNLSRRSKAGLVGVFGIGAAACCLDIARIVELTVDTDDKVDPSYGVVIFLLLTAATEVAAITCLCLPIVAPHAFKKFRNRHQGPSWKYKYPQGDSSDKSSGPNSYQSSGGKSRIFDGLGSNGQWEEDTVGLAKSGAVPRADGRAIALGPLRTMTTTVGSEPESIQRSEPSDDGRIRVDKEVEVVFGSRSSSSQGKLGEPGWHAF